MFHIKVSITLVLFFLVVFNTLKLKQSHYTPRRRLGERRYSSYSFSTSALDGVSGQSHAWADLYAGERTTVTHWTGGWVDLRAGLDTEFRGKILLPLPVIDPRSPGRPARRQTLYWLSYTAHVFNAHCTLFSGVRYIQKAVIFKHTKIACMCYNKYNSDRIEGMCLFHRTSWSSGEHSCFIFG
jgi:hypothetical protein